MSDLNSEISIAFQATPLILVFITILFGIIYPQIQDGLNKISPEGKEKEKDFREELRQSILYKCVPLILITFATFCLFIPLLRRIFMELSSSLWNLDFAPTSLVFITILIFIFFIWSILNDFIVKRTEERSESKELLKEKMKEEKLSKIICNILLLNAGLSEGNIQIIKTKEYDPHLNPLKTGFLDLAINNVSFDEEVGDDDIIMIMNISVHVEAINIKILRRDELIKKINEVDSQIIKSSLKESVIKLNEELVENSNNLIKQINDYASY